MSLQFCFKGRGELKIQMALTSKVKMAYLCEAVKNQKWPPPNKKKMLHPLQCNGMLLFLFTGLAFGKEGEGDIQWVVSGEGWGEPWKAHGEGGGWW